MKDMEVLVDGDSDRWQGWIVSDGKYAMHDPQDLKHPLYGSPWVNYESCDTLSLIWQTSESGESFFS